MSSSRSRLAAALRGLGLGLTGLLVVALTLAVGGAALVWPAPDERPLEPETISVTSGATSWVCASAPTLPTAEAGADLDYDPELGTGGGTISTSVDLVAIGPDGAPEMTVGPLGEAGAPAETAGDLALSTSTDVAAPVVGVVEPTAAGVPLVAGASVARADAGDLRGLSATPCRQPVTSALLVGGSTELGSSTRLVLSNPGETAASVAITGWGATGPLPEVAPVVVPAGGVRAVLLETLSLEPRVAIRLDVEGGRVAPTLQDSSLDGLVPVGTETIGPTADPTTTLTIGGLSISGASGAAATLRLVNPGEEPATVAVETLGQEGAELLAGAEATIVEPGTVVDISLAGLESGASGLRVTSDVPVTGAVQLVRTGTAGEDDPDTPPTEVAWVPAAAPVDRGALPLPTALVDTRRVVVTNPGDAATEVALTPVDAGGAVVGESTTTLAAGSSAVVEVPDDAVAAVVEGEGVLATVVLVADAADGPLIAAVPLVPDPFVEQSVAVRVDS